MTAISAATNIHGGVYQPDAPNPSGDSSESRCADASGKEDAKELADVAKQAHSNLIMGALING